MDPGNDDDGKALKWQVEGEKRSVTVGVTAPTGPVRDVFRPRPWAGACASVDRAARKPSAHGHIADGGGPEIRLERRMRWSAAWHSVRRSVL